MEIIYNILSDSDKIAIIDDMIKGMESSLFRLETQYNIETLIESSISNGESYMQQINMHKESIDFLLNKKSLINSGMEE
jgi:hypothetical protein